MRIRSLTLAATIVAGPGGSLFSQAAVSRDSIVSGSLTVVQSRPQGAFGQHTGMGYGVAGAVLLRVDQRGIFSLRADVGGLEYGNENKRSPLSDEIGGRVQVNVRTTNYIVPMSVGPQITWPTGLVRPYVNAGIGGQLFFTESTVEGTSDHLPIASTTNHSDASASWTVGSGLYVRLPAGRVPVMLDLGAQYIDGGRARYLAPGSIVDLPAGQIRVTPIESKTQMMVVRLGVRIGR